MFTFLSYSLHHCWSLGSKTLFLFFFLSVQFHCCEQDNLCFLSIFMFWVIWPVEVKVVGTSCVFPLSWKSLSFSQVLVKWLKLLLIHESAAWRVLTSHCTVNMIGLWSFKQSALTQTEHFLAIIGAALSAHILPLTMLLGIDKIY